MKRVLTLMAVTVLAATPAVGQRAQDATPTPEMAGLQAEYRDEQARARRLRAEAADATAEIAALERQLSALRRDQNTGDVQLSAQRARLAELSRQEARLVAALSTERGHQGRLLSALQMMTREPPPPLLVPADKAIDTVRAAILMQAMAPTLEARAQTLVGKQAEIARVRRLAVLSSERLFTTESAQGDRRAQIESLTTRKTALNAVLKAEALSAERAAATLEARIRTLGGDLKPSEVAETAIASTRLPGGRSRLTPPIAGTPSTRFGGGSEGWRWLADAQTVSAPAAAEIGYAGPISGWGQVVMLKLGPGWHAVVGGLDEVTVQTGDRVTDGQSIGRSRPDGEVYFELRREERPVDPAPWLP